MIVSVEEMITKYVAAWNEQGLDAYKTAFGEIWADDATYTDPNFALVKGVDGIVELAYSSLPLMPARKFSVLIMPDYHHNAGRYTWEVKLPEETKEGFDYFEFNEEFKITKLVSFF